MKKYKTEAERKEAKRLAQKKYRKSEKGKKTVNIYNKKYRSTEKGKQALERYNVSEKGIKTKKESSQRYFSSKKGKQARTRYGKSDKKKQATKRYFSSKKGKQARARYGISDKKKQAFKRWRSSDKGKQFYKKYNSRPQIKLAKNLRTQVYNALKRQGGKKSKKTMELVGCTINYLRKYLEKQFKPEMTWDNYGKWHVDHIIPVTKFDLTDPKLQKICFNYKNLQPLWASENIRKSNK